MIFYFSGTGNTQWVAEQLAGATGERLINIAKEIDGDCHYELTENERIGFCFPTHGWQPPHIVREFISKMHIHQADGHYCFAVTTCGDDCGMAMTMLNGALRKHGLTAESLFSIIMPESYVCLPLMHTDTPEREREKLTAARERLRHIAAVICERQTGIVSLRRGPTPRLYTYVLGAAFNRWLITDRPFKVDEQQCIQCGKCVKVCPVNNIAGAPPVWKHNERCTCCLACYHHCPVHAIQYGKLTRHRGQYYFGRSTDSSQ